MKAQAASNPTSASSSSDAGRRSPGAAAFVPVLLLGLAGCAHPPRGTDTRPLVVLRQAELMARQPALAVPGEVRVWNMQRSDHSRTNLIEFSGRSPLHSHPDAHHTLLVVKGAVGVRAGTQELRLQAGDYISIPPGMPHAYWVDAGHSALLVSFDAPAYDDRKTVWLEPRR